MKEHRLKTLRSERRKSKSPADNSEGSALTMLDELIVIPENVQISAKEMEKLQHKKKKMMKARDVLLRDIEQSAAQVSFLVATLSYSQLDPVEIDAVTSERNRDQSMEEQCCRTT